MFIKCGMNEVYLFLLLNPSSEVIVSIVIFLLCKKNFFEDGLVSLCSLGCPGTQSVDQPGLALRSTCLYIPSAGIKSVCETLGFI